MKKNSKSITHQQMNGMNFRYKKNAPPVDEFADKNGPVRIVKPATRRAYWEPKKSFPKP